MTKTIWELQFPKYKCNLSASTSLRKSRVFVFHIAWEGVLSIFKTMLFSTIRELTIKQNKKIASFVKWKWWKRHRPGMKELYLLYSICFIVYETRINHALSMLLNNYNVVAHCRTIIKNVETWINYSPWTWLFLNPSWVLRNMFFFSVGVALTDYGSEVIVVPDDQSGTDREFFSFYCHTALPFLTKEEIQFPYKIVKYVWVCL